MKGEGRVKGEARRVQGSGLGVGLGVRVRVRVKG